MYVLALCSLLAVLTIKLGHRTFFTSHFLKITSISSVVKAPHLKSSVRCEFDK